MPVLEGIDQWDVEHIHEALFAKIAELGVKNGWMLWPVRTAVSGKQFTPGGGVELCAILGKQDTWTAFEGHRQAVGCCGA